jgi:hypothetical protein
MELVRGLFVAYVVLIASGIALYVFVGLEHL